ncbi:hypothetical protein COCSADRAFT_44482, partial [Bipolaris sorokiniana ND90Pr]
NRNKVQSTYNLFKALQTLVIRFLDSYLWNDMTCINQKDIKEVNVQVAIMAKIYAAAHRVIIWLEKSDEETERCLHLHRQI